jgi:hypothetical protein
MEIEGTETIEQNTANKCGRPPKNAIAMTPAERKAASRKNRKEKEQHAEREDVIAALVKEVEMDKKWYLEKLMELSIEELREHKDLTAKLMEIYRSRQAHIISKAEEQRRIARRNEIRYRQDLTRLSIEDLRLTFYGVSSPSDTKGRLTNERRSGETGNGEIERIAAAIERNRHGRRVSAEGPGPDPFDHPKGAK